MSKIALCGSMSVGKTSLVNALKEDPHFKDYIFQTERSKYLRDLGIPLNTDSTLIGQTIFCAERGSELLNDNIITDRSIIDVMAFTRTSKSMSRVEKEAICQLGSLLLPQYDYIFYIPCDGIEIEDNGVRCTDARFRNLIDKTIKELIQKYRYNIKNLYMISGSTEERIKEIKRVINLTYL